MLRKRWMIPIACLVMLLAVSIALQHEAPLGAQDEAPPNPVVYSAATEGDYYDLFVLDVTTNTSTQLSSGSANSVDPNLSPDGAWIAFASDRDGDYEIFLLRVDGSEGRQLTTNDGITDRQPRWLSDSQLVYSSLVDDQWDLYLLDLSTSESSALTDDEAFEVGPDFGVGEAPAPELVSSTTAPNANANVATLNIRSGSPGTGSSVAAVVNQGDPLTIIGRLADNTWVQVVTADGVEGWVFTELLTLEVDLSTIPVVNATLNNPAPPAATEVPQQTESPSNNDNPPPPPPDPTTQSPPATESVD